ncbi:recombinase family protein [uncultured Tateyamaria sp.]|uniref:recombinase family protein n=1 Tax=uncultured Tateyamaria sp. TaxID=455651 RepID=UPI00261A70C7|nr:recombinase family protein [uncultured Tateyamaria sp.]
MIPCFGYVRVSTLKQGEGASLEAQKDAIMGFASHNNLQVVEWFEEQETARKKGRPVFDRMTRDLQAGKAQGVIVHRLDRTARNFGDWATISELADQGVKVFCAGDNIDFDSRSGRLMADIQMVLATDYSRNLSIEVKKGQSQRLKQGYWPWRAPLGYIDMGEGELKVPCPKKAPLVKELFRLYLSGEHSITSLTGAMRQRGLTGYYDRRLARRNVEAILRNPYFCGQLVSKQGVFKGKHIPLVSVRDFNRVQAVKSARHVKKATKHVYKFRNTFTCGHCNTTLTGERQKAHIYYRCHTKGCPARSIREDRLDDAVQQGLAEFQWTEEQTSVFRQSLEGYDLFKQQEELRGSLNLRVADIQTRQTRLTDLFIDGKLAEAEFNMRDQQLKLDLEQIDEEREQLARTMQEMGDVESLLEFVSNVSNLYRVATDQEARALLRKIYSIRLIVDGQLQLTAREMHPVQQTHASIVGTTTSRG